MLSLHLLIALIAVALLFDFLNGLHDAANSIATVVSTRVLKPQYAVIWAAFFNFIAFLVFGLHVATTIGTGLVSPSVIDSAVIFAALVGAIFWNVVTWLFGIPSSSSHALIGGLLGAGIAKAGFGVIVWGGVGKTVSAILLSPALGLVLAMMLILAFTWIFARSTPLAVDRKFRKIQLVSAALYSLGHGGNDAQKTMGIIAVLLYANGRLHGAFHIPAVGGARLPERDGDRHARGRLADRPHDGIEDNAAHAHAGVQRRDWRRDHLVHGDLARHPGFNHAHDHRRDRRRRRVASFVRRALERRLEHRRRVGGDAARIGAGGGAHLRGDAGVRIGRENRYRRSAALASRIALNSDVGRQSGQ